MSQTYKMRGEYENDYHRAMELWKKNKISVATMRYENSILFPDFELTIQTDQSKEKLIEALKQGEDLHVMYQTLEIEHEYTGIRKRQ